MALRETKLGKTGLGEMGIGETNNLPNATICHRPRWSDLKKRNELK